MLPCLICLKCLIRRAALAWWVGLLALAFAGPVFAQDAPVMVATKVSPSAWYVQGQSAMGSPANQNFISNAGFIVTGQGVVVVDAWGSPQLAERLISEIRKVTAQPITHLIVTHYHADHIYGLQAFKAVGARVIAHRAARDYLTSDTARLRLEASRLELAPWINAQTPATWIRSKKPTRQPTGADSTSCRCFG